MGWKQLKEEFEDRGIVYCEMCGSTWGLTPAHRHKRNWYKGKNKDKLWDFDQVLLLCLECHMGIEYSREATAKEFRRLRDMI